MKKYRIKNVNDETKSFLLPPPKATSCMLVNSYMYFHLHAFSPIYYVKNFNDVINKKAEPMIFEIDSDIDELLTASLPEGKSYVDFIYIKFPAETVPYREMIRSLFENFIEILAVIRDPRSFFELSEDKAEVKKNDLHDSCKKVGYLDECMKEWEQHINEPSNFIFALLGLYDFHDNVPDI